MIVRYFKRAIIFSALLIAILQIFSCKKHSLDDLIPEVYDGNAEYVMNGNTRTSYAGIILDNSLPCYLGIFVDDFFLGQITEGFSITRIEFCESVGDTLQVISIGSENRREPGLPIGKYMTLEGGDILTSIAGPSAHPAHENYVVIESYDEDTGLVRASYKLQLTSSPNIDSAIPPEILDIEGTVEAIL